ncbi:hypothetical protein MKZ38_000343 [Zalerion maritima]|uniref:Rab-GAP TBC domain-containing protein n=1 Tax=Zalerion maritima TaxID=339359 RepID=A0AAD5WSK4_9PEZI|nr:hypothetical protein MKZ38_000343 [Zalerion maritima]
MASESAGQDPSQDDPQPSPPPHQPNGSPSITSTNPTISPEKEANILQACKWKNIDGLRSLAISDGGFFSDALRQLAWPILLGCGKSNQETEDAGDHEKNLPSTPWKDLPRHQDEDQVKLDVDRAFVYYPTPISDARLASETACLSDLITEVLRQHPYLSYFQGYHDICQVFQLILPGKVRYEAVSRLSVLRIRDFMLPTLAGCITQLRLIPELISLADPELALHLGIGSLSPLKSESPLTFLAALARDRDDESIADSVHLSAMQGTLTMYAHDIESLARISRLFDALLAHEPVFSLYLFAEMVLSRREELINSAGEDPDILLWTLQKLPSSHASNLDEVVQQAARLYERVPPAKLKGWGAISENSVLKTGTHPLRQSEALGETWFNAQVKELKQAERRKKMIVALRKYKKPAGRMFGIAMLVGFIAILFKREAGTGWVVNLLGWKL